MTNKTKAAIEEAAKLPTSEETLSQTYKSAGWRYDISVLPTGCPHESLALDAIESHTAAHTAGLRERVKELESKIASYESAIDGLKKVVDSLVKIKSL
jgi:hypothetical protein